MLLDQPARDIASDRHPVADREPGLRHVDADVVGAGIFGDEVVTQIRAVALRIDREEARVLASAPSIDDLLIMPWPKSAAMTTSYSGAISAMVRSTSLLHV